MAEVDGTISIEIDTSSYVDELSTFIYASKEAVEHALRVVARELLRDTKLYVPVLTGALKDSGQVKELPTLNDAIKTVSVIYGNPQVTYAFLQHEMPFNHPSLGFRGPAKFLEKPLVNNAQFYLALFTAEVRIALERKY